MYIYIYVQIIHNQNSIFKSPFDSVLNLHFFRHRNSLGNVIRDFFPSTPSTEARPPQGANTPTSRLINYTHRTTPITFHRILAV